MGAKLQITFSEEALARLQAEAKRRRVSKAEIVRRALALWFETDRAATNGPEGQPLLGFVGICPEEQSQDVSSRVDEILYGPPS